MSFVLSYLASATERAHTVPLPAADAQAMAAELASLTGLQVYAASIVAADQSLLFLSQRQDEKRLDVLSVDPAAANGFTGEPRAVTVSGAALTLLLGAPDATNAAALRRTLPFLRPRPIGLRRSIGCGDRLGLATPGHIAALRHTFPAGPPGAMAPILAQQSMRENARTRRTPQQVLDDATWGAFQAGWRDGFGADADHLKSLADVDLCAAAGYTTFTVDPGDHVDALAERASAAELLAKVEALPWDALESSPADLRRRWAGRSLNLDGESFAPSGEEILRAAAKYGRAVAHTAQMYRRLCDRMAGQAFELEISVDETESVTTRAEHAYVAGELKRLGVRWVSIAPRYVGRFEKGVDYIGDLGEFARSFAEHLAVARVFGPYKLSLHSGSDKFSLYAIAARLGGELVHLKTAGTSYLEALRALALLAPPTFREVVAFAGRRYAEDRASYHVSADPARLPDLSGRPDDGLAAVLDDFHARQVLHVTFGSVVQHPVMRATLLETLRAHEDVYHRFIEAHFNRHMQPFAAQTG